MSNGGIKTPNIPLGISISEFIGHEIVGTTRSTKRFTVAQVLGPIQAAVDGFQAGGGIVFASKIAANQHLAYNQYQMAWVVLDAVPANNGIYQKQGVSGTGSWTRVADLPYSFFRVENVGAGTANAIIATNDFPLASAESLVILPIAVTTTSSTVTVAFNGGTPLRIKTSGGNDPAPGGLVAGMVVGGYIDGDEFRLLSDQASAAIQTAAEAAQAAAEAARDVATGAMSTFFENLFPTKAVAAAYAPSAAPDELWVGGVAVVGDTSIILYKKNGTTTGDLVITLSDATTLVGYDVAGPVINAAGCGLSPSATGAVNLAALKKAVSLCPVGGTVWVPPLSGTCTVDTSGGLSDAVLIDKTITVRVDADLKASKTDTIEANPGYMFKVAADYVKFCGSGTIEGDGTADVTYGGGEAENFPGLIYVRDVTGFTFTGITLVKPPKTGIYMRDCINNNLRDFVVSGGLAVYNWSTILDPSDPNFGEANPAYVGSYLCAITTTGGEGHTIDNVRFLVGADGGRMANAIFSGGYGATNALTITRCYADRPWEKLGYLYGDRHLVDNCRVDGSFNGVVQTSGYSDAIRLWGSNNVMSNCIIQNCHGGVQALDGAGNKIINNQIRSCSGVAINVQHFSADYTGNISQNEVSGNFVSYNAITAGVTAGIIFWSAYNGFTHVICDNNTVQGYGSAETYGAIHMEGANGVFQPQLIGNVIISYATGILLKNALSANVKDTNLRIGTNVGVLIDSGDDCEVSGTTGIDVGSYALGRGTATNTRFINNNTRGATNIGVKGGFSDGNYGRNNQYTDKPLIGSATLAASATTTVTHGGVAPNAIIQMLGGDGPYQVLVDTSGFYTSPNFTHFTVVRANGGAPAGTETFHYEVIQ